MSNIISELLFKPNKKTHHDQVDEEDQLELEENGAAYIQIQKTKGLGIHSIHINPKFRSTHINPKFKSAHINPRFASVHLNPNPKFKNAHINPKFKNVHINPNFDNIHITPNPIFKSAHINPKFKNAHINPNFIANQNFQQNPSNNIYVNPNFIKEPLVSTNINGNFDMLSFPQLSDATTTEETYSTKTTSHHPNDSQDNITPNKKALIILKTGRKLIRQSAIKQNLIMDHENNKNKINSRHRLIKIGQRKLIRSNSQLHHIVSKSNDLLKKSIIKPTNTKYNLVSNLSSHYNKRSASSNLISKDNDSSETRIQPDNYISRYSLKRCSSSNLENWSSKQFIIGSKKILKLGKLNLKQMSTKCIQKNEPNAALLNINGVSYKSTRTKLQKTFTPATTVSSTGLVWWTNNKQSVDYKNSKTIFVQGEKFVLEANGHKLIRQEQTNETEKSTELNSNQRKRIDFGHFTYVKKSPDIYERTNDHKTRFYLTAKKKKSIQLLSRSKNNIICAMYRKFGKCREFERNQCKKLHDPKCISICPKYLKGECLNNKCLLSHNVSFSKMPVCKYFLIGTCVRNDCPYLHKKLNEKEQICLDFIKGFCEQAALCNKRHEFLCPEYEKKGKCDVIRCLYPHVDKKIEQTNPVLLYYHLHHTDLSTTTEIENSSKCNVERKIDKLRYFTTDESDGNLNVKDNNTIEISAENNEILILKNCESVECEQEDNKLHDQQKFRKRQEIGNLPSFIPLQ